jgi:hypothetical protein
VAVLSLSSWPFFLAGVQMLCLEIRIGGKSDSEPVSQGLALVLKTLKSC